MPRVTLSNLPSFKDLGEDVKERFGDLTRPISQFWEDDFKPTVRKLGSISKTFDVPDNQIRDPIPEDYANAPYAALVQDVFQYEGDDAPLAEGFETLHLEDGMDSGFAGGAYYNDETNELVIAFRGTDTRRGLKQLSKDGEADMDVIMGRDMSQTDDAMDYADRMLKLAKDKGLNVDEVTYTGQSLGGALATQVAGLRALENGEENTAVVFEAPGSKKSLEDRLGRNLTPEEEAMLRRSQVNYRVDTPISDPNLRLTGTAHHSSEVVNLHNDPHYESPPKKGGPLGAFSHLRERHNIMSIRKFMDERAKALG